MIGKITARDVLAISAGILAYFLTQWLLWTAIYRIGPFYAQGPFKTDDTSYVFSDIPEAIACLVAGVLAASLGKWPGYLLGMITGALPIVGLTAVHWVRMTNHLYSIHVYLFLWALSSVSLVTMLGGLAGAFWKHQRVNQIETRYFRILAAVCTGLAAGFLLRWLDGLIVAFFQSRVYEQRTTLGYEDWTRLILPHALEIFRYGLGGFLAGAIARRYPALVGGLTGALLMALSLTALQMNGNLALKDARPELYEVMILLLVAWIVISSVCGLAGATASESIAKFAKAAAAKIVQVADKLTDPSPSRDR